MGGQERRPSGNMAAAMSGLAKLTEVIDHGREGAVVTMPLELAPLWLRISGDTLKEMGARRQELGISVAKNNIVIELHGGQASRREAYRFLYGLIQSLPGEQADLFLKTQKPPQELSEIISDFDESVKVIQKGCCGLPDEELTRLHIHLMALWLSLRDQSGLPGPENVLSAVIR